MKRQLLSLLALSTMIATPLSSFASTALWTLDTNATANKSSNNTVVSLSLDQSTLDALLQNTPKENTSSQGYTIEIPLPSGELIELELFEYSMMEPELAAQFSYIKTYKAVGKTDKFITGRFDITPKGFSGIVSTLSETYYFDPVQTDTTQQRYQTYARSAYIENSNSSTFTCGVKHDSDLSNKLSEKPVISAAQISGSKLHTYRLAMAATGEYTALHGGTVNAGQAAIVTAINRINEIYAREIAVQYTLIANNSLLVYTNAGSDPYTNDDGFAMLEENQTNIDTVISSDNYDIGHVFSTGGGGIAALQAPCGAAKAEGVTGLGTPTSDAFWVDYVAHEIGHQMGANHTFNGDQGSCVGGNRSSTNAYEPGSGSTIMAYAGICGSDNIVNSSDDYFHTNSLEEIAAFTSGNGSSCGTHIDQSNQIPTANAGNDFTIPQQTPFELTGSGIDGDGDTLTYNWEQHDLGDASAPGIDNRTGPIFRSFSPSTTPIRTLPLLSTLISNSSPPTGSVLPSTNRSLNFRLTVRDGNGAVTSDDAQLTVTTTSGPFAVTSQSSSTNWASNTQETITWNVASTSSAPVSCSAVDILFSIDNGLTFSTTIIAGTSNDGTQSVTVPNVNTSQGRIKIKCSDNIFFDMSNGTITIDTSANAAPVVNDFNFTVDAGESNIDQFAASDAENNDLTFSIVSQPTQGTLSVNGDSYTYTANGDASGADSFVVKANDGAADSANATASITIIPANNPPVISNFNFSITAGESNTSSFSATDADDDTLTFSIVSGPSKGSLSINGSNYTYTANADASGSDSFVVKANDTKDDSANATATVAILATSTIVSGADGDNFQATVTSSSVDVIGWQSAETITSQSPEDNGVITNTLTSEDISISFSDSEAITTSMSATSGADSCIAITVNGLTIDVDSLTATDELRTEVMTDTRIQLQRTNGCNLQTNITDGSNVAKAVTQLPALSGSIATPLNVTITESGGVFTVRYNNVSLPVEGLIF
ncbi:hypothetical protein A9Q81_19675 [Gammaproteobacteria bacterium 42_54_T18]|nr:hypothetical protein A9Q81_19675 [Gammaproteobacteria bacterium 42_54_T18]